MSEKETEQNHSQHEANKMLRVLTGKPLKFTARVHYLDGRILEFQSEDRPALKYNDEARSLFLVKNNYEHDPILQWEPGMVLFLEENPKP